VSEIWWTADDHFGHAAIIRYCNRPFAHVDEMNEALIRAWNDRVGPRDSVYHVGDFAFARFDAIFGRLNGSIHLIRGNHDKGLKPAQLQRFASVSAYLEIKLHKQSITMCHYPMLAWNKSHYGSWMLHGHSHGSCKANRSMTAKRMDVGVDCNDYKPFSFEEIEKYMALCTFKGVDKHEPRT
jgi:calcineurin-like phosphoesterase family protein